MVGYFGVWPEWINLFMESCKRNSDVDWLIHTDCGPPENRPPNVHIREIKFSEYCALVSSRLGINFKPQGAYKLCDLKPALGYIHSEDVRDFDFWGYCDIDLIFGDIRSIYTDAVLDAYDVISSHASIVSGHLSLFRNTKLLRTAFRRVAGWRTVMELPEQKSFDEAQFSRLFWKRGRPKRFWKFVPPALSPYCRRNCFAEQYSTILIDLPWIDGTYNHPQAWYWRDGKITNDKDGEREFLYFHFMAWKSPDYTVPKPPDGLAAWQKVGKIVQVDWRDASKNGFALTPMGISSLDQTRPWFGEV